MNFSKNSSNFFRGKTFKSFFQNKYSCSFFNSNLNKSSTRNFVTFSNLFFMASLQKLILTSKSIGMQTSSLMIGSTVQNGESILESSLLSLEKLAEGPNALSELIIIAKSNQ